jgi:signal transduction histidine kinase
VEVPPRLDSASAAFAPAVRDALLALVAAARQVADGDRAALLLLDDDGSIVPVASAGRVADLSVWSQVRPVPLADLSAVRDALAVLSAGRAVGIDDSAACPWLPAPLREAYHVASAGIAPLVAGGATLGALVVYAHTPRRYADADLAALGGLASGAATVVQSALDAESDASSAAAREALIANAALLQRATDVDDVLGCALAAAADITRGTPACAGLVSPAGDVTLLPDHPHRECRVADLGPHAAFLDTALSNGEPLVLPAGALAPWTGRQSPDATVVVVPLGDAGGPRAFAAVRCPTGEGTGPATLAVLARLREQVGGALVRARQNADVVRRVQHLEVLYQLAEDVALAPDIHLVVERLAPAVRAAARAELIDVFLCDAAASRLFGTNTARGTLTRLMSRWRRSPRARVAHDAGLLVIPMLLDGALVGVVRVRPLLGHELEPAEEHLLQTIADGLGEMVSRTVLRDRVACSERELAVADERERIAHDLHDTLGQMHFAVRTELGALAASCADQELQARLAALEGIVSRADTELRQAINALSFLGRGSHGLVPSVRSLVRRIRDEQRLDVTLKLVGTPVSLPPDQEEALYRLAREALTNVARHARASFASVTVTFEPDRVSVDIRDNGTGLLARPAGEHGLHFGLRSMQRRLADVGGGLHVRNRQPHGVTVSGWVPGA